MAPFTVAGLSGVLEQLLPEPHAGLMAGLLFGTKASLGKPLTDALIASGTIHIIALSGMNITIIADLVATTLMPIVGKRIASVLTLGLVVWFVWFVGPSATIVRAAIMGSLSLISIVFGRQYWGMLSFLLTVGVMLLVHSEWATEISFQLSAAATLGIILFGRKKEEKPGVIPFLKNELHITLSAQVFTIPLILLYFRRISLIAPLTNLAIGWMIPYITIAGWATVLVGWVWTTLAAPFAWVDWVLLRYLLGMVGFFGHMPFASLSF